MSTTPDAISRGPSFAVRDCALVALGTGRQTRHLHEFRSILSQIDTACIEHHFWGGMLQPRFEEREYNNDFAAWVWHGIHDAILAEQLSALHPAECTGTEALRHRILELIDNRIDDDEHLLWTRATLPFEFIRSQIVIFDTDYRLERPEELPSAIITMSMSSIFYHFIDARRRTAEGRDDFSDWLAGYGEPYVPLRERLAGIDPYFSSLAELRDRLGAAFAEHFRKGAP